MESRAGGMVRSVDLYVAVDAAAIEDARVGKPPVREVFPDEEIVGVAEPSQLGVALVA